MSTNSMELGWPMRLYAQVVVGLGGGSLPKLYGSICPNGNTPTTTESEFVDMSKIWDRLRELEPHQNQSDFIKGTQDNFVLGSDRRCSKRIWAFEPVLVYGRAAA